MIACLVGLRQSLVRALCVARLESANSDPPVQPIPGESDPFVGGRFNVLKSRAARQKLRELEAEFGGLVVAGCWNNLDPLRTKAAVRPGHVRGLSDEEDPAVRP